MAHYIFISRVLCLVEEATSAVEATSVADTTTTTTTTTMFRQFLSRTEFDTLLSSAKSSSKLKIQKWRSLEVGAVFRVLDVVEIPTKCSAGIYAVLETETGESINVWITPLIHEELLKHNYNNGSVFIKPLGTKQSSVTGKDYFNFAIVIANNCS